jgi:hypothetical protein
MEFGIIGELFYITSGARRFLLIVIITNSKMKISKLIVYSLNI